MVFLKQNPEKKFLILNSKQTPSIDSQQSNSQLLLCQEIFTSNINIMNFTLLFENLNHIL